MSLSRYAAAPAQRRGSRAPWLIFAIVAAIALVALVLAGLRIAPTETGSPVARPAGTSPPGPQLAGKRPSPTRKAAIEAAVAALSSLAVPALTEPRRFERSVRRMAARGHEPSVRSAFGAGDKELREMLTGSVVRAAPLGYRVEHFDRRAAAVSIWTVTLATGRHLRPRASWRRVTIDLIWQRGRWLVTGGAGGEAPSPSSSGRAVIAEAGTYSELRHGP